MVKLQYVDEVTFATEEIEFSDDMYAFAENLRQQYIHASFCSPLMVGSDKKSLIFGVSGSNGKHRVIIESLTDK
jgi:hypothetical protein